MWQLLPWSFLCTALAAPVLTVHEKRQSIGSERLWKRATILDNKEAIIPVRIGLAQSNLDEGYDHVMQISHPSSEDYGQYWTREQVETEFAPSSSTVDQVMQWLEDAGVENAEQTANKGWIAFDAPVGQVEQLLNATFYEYETSREDSVRLGCDEYSVPQHIAHHIDYITPGVRLSLPVWKRAVSLGKRQSGSNSTSPRKHFNPARVKPHHGPKKIPVEALSLAPDLRYCGYNITPPCLRYLYGIPEPGAQVAEGAIGVYEFEESYSQSDLNLYFADLAPEIPKGTRPTVVKLDGVRAPAPLADAGQEANVDFMVVYFLLGDQPVTFYDVGLPNGYNGSAYDDLLVAPLLDAIEGSFCTGVEKKDGFHCGGYNLTQVVSISYGLPEFFFSTAAAQKRVCNEMMKLSLQGHTFVAATGDYGVGANPSFSENEFSDNGCTPFTLQDTFDGSIFMVNFPATCPYVLSVGATMLYPNQTVQNAESAMHVQGVGYTSFNPSVSFSSTGGFANYFDRPSYQDSAVTKYLKKHKPGYKTYNATTKGISSGNSNIGHHNGVYNLAGRGLPDVSANGVNVTAYYQGEAFLFDGTSNSAPIWASVLTLINSALSAAGKGPVGFVNPVLYENPSAFHDIVNGTNPGCGTEGFSAVPGWDPITGLGTPNYSALLEVFMNTS